MTSRIELQPAYVLHSRPYRDTSLIVDLLTEHLGRVAVVARGARKSKQRVRQQLQPFSPLLVSFQGKGELKTLTGVEPAGRMFFLGGRELFSGFYLNELLMRLLPVLDPHPCIYSMYAGTLSALQPSAPLEPLLRKFEFTLLMELGYGVPLGDDADTGAPLKAERFYRFDPHSGFFACEETSSQNCFSGHELLAIAAGEYGLEAVNRAAKRLARQALKPHLGSSPLKSRELFIQQKMFLGAKNTKGQ